MAPHARYNPLYARVAQTRVPYGQRAPLERGSTARVRGTPQALWLKRRVPRSERAALRDAAEAARGGTT